MADDIERVIPVARVNGRKVLPVTPRSLDPDAKEPLPLSSKRKAAPGKSEPLPCHVTADKVDCKI